MTNAKTAQRILGHFQFRQTGNEWRWTKYTDDSSTTVVAKSSEGYRNKSQAIANAEKFGHQGNWNKCDTDAWTAWQSSRDNKWYWKREDFNNKLTVGASHTGFASEAAALGNAQMNGMP